MTRSNIKATLLWVNEKFQPFYLAFHYFDFCLVIRSNIKGTLVWVNMKRMSFNLGLCWRAAWVISLKYPMPALRCDYNSIYQVVQTQPSLLGCTKHKLTFALISQGTNEIRFTGMIVRNLPFCSSSRVCWHLSLHGGVEGVLL